MAKTGKRACGLCGKAGHNARTCPTASGRTKPGQKAAKPSAATPATAPAIEASTVHESLEARASYLRLQIAGIEPMQRELKLLEKVLGELRSVGGGA